MARESGPPENLPALGDLEIAVLEHVWASGAADVKDTHAALGIARGISPNTVQSALERLFRKGLLDRVKSGHSYRYSARVGRDELVAGLINDVLGRFGADRSAALAAFVDSADELDPDTLRELEAILRRHRDRGGET